MKKRLDVLVSEQFLLSREKAKALIMAGAVRVDGEKADKAGTSYPENVVLELLDNGPKYVSRGGLKLEKAMAVFPVTLDGKVCGDIGASTGGFTDCMLQNKASRVYAVDVGYGQLAWKLRNDERVVNLERTNIRNVTEKEIPELLDFCSIDVSFISLSLVLPVVYRLLKEDGECVALIKPQFEAGKGKVGKKGVVREPKIHLEVLEKVYGIAKEIGFSFQGIDFSPIKGPEGNIEYLGYLKKSSLPPLVLGDSLTEVVSVSHQCLDRKGDETT